MKHRPPLDPGFVPAVVWNRNYAADVAKTAGSEPLAIALERGDGTVSVFRTKARAICETIGVCFGYAIAHYADFYEIRNLLILGRVTSGEGGEIIIGKAAAVLHDEFPEIAIKLRTPDEKDKRHGQAVAAASLPKLG